MAEYIRTGNIKLLFCFAFYLASWVVGFNPWRPIRGLKSGWLLIPAVILGVLALWRVAPKMLQPRMASERPSGTRPLLAPRCAPAYASISLAFIPSLVSRYP